MKQKDLVLIVVIVFISAVISYLVSNNLITSPKDRQQKVEEVKEISAEFKRPDRRYFNDQSVNPTKLIQIGQNGNPDPFRGGSQ